MTAPRILLTGATGFVGRHLSQTLLTQGFTVRAAIREGRQAPAGTEAVTMPGLDEQPDWSKALAGVDAVIHAAGIAHATDEIPEARYQAVNHAATLHLARSAQGQAGRFIFLSSIRAQTGPVAPGRVLTEADAPQPTDAYGRSKLAAERELKTLENLPAASLRPVLVYGAGVGGNMGALLKLAKLPVPLPFGALHAPRSLVSVDTLAAAAMHILRSPQPLTGPFIVADPSPVSVAEIVSALRSGLGRSSALLPVPRALLKTGLSVLGRGAMMERLDGALVADAAALRASGFVPDIETTEGLQKLARISSQS